jgi:hypothetical protein
MHVRFWWGNLNERGHKEEVRVNIIAWIVSKAEIYAGVRVYWINLVQDRERRKANVNILVP